MQNQKIKKFVDGGEDFSKNVGKDGGEGVGEVDQNVLVTDGQTKCDCRVTLAAEKFSLKPCCIKVIVFRLKNNFT